MNKKIINKLISAALLLTSVNTIAVTSVFADCQATGSSFARRSQNCEKSVVYNNQYNNYYYNYYPNYNFQNRRPDYNRPRPDYYYRPKQNYKEMLDRQYAPQYGSSLPFRGNNSSFYSAR